MNARLPLIIPYALCVKRRVFVCERRVLVGKRNPQSQRESASTSVVTSSRAAAYSMQCDLPRAPHNLTWYFILIRNTVGGAAGRRAGRTFVPSKSCPPQGTPQGAGATTEADCVVAGAVGAGVDRYKVCTPDVYAIASYSYSVTRSNSNSLPLLYTRASLTTSNAGRGD